MVGVKRVVFVTNLGGTAGIRSRPIVDGRFLLIFMESNDSCRWHVKSRETFDSIQARRFSC